MPEPTFFEHVGCFTLIKIPRNLGARGSSRLFFHSSKLFGDIYSIPTVTPELTCLCLALPYHQGGLTRTISYSPPLFSVYLSFDPTSIHHIEPNVIEHRSCPKAGLGYLLLIYDALVFLGPQDIPDLLLQSTNNIFGCMGRGLSLRGGKSAMETELAPDTFNAMGGIDVLHQGDLVACR